MAEAPYERSLNLFGFEIKRKKPEKEKERVSFVPPKEEEGVGQVINAGGYFGQYVDMERGLTGPSDKDLIIKYRDVAQQPEVDKAINDIVEEVIVSGVEGYPVELKVDNLEQSDRIKNIILEEFENVLELLEFSYKGSDIFRSFYIDGRIYYHKIIDEKNPSNGILELRYIDPTKIKKVKELIEDKDPKTGAKLIKGVREYFVFQNENLTKLNQGLKINKDSIAMTTSGAVDPSHKRVLSYLHKAIKPINQLRMMEDSLVIYRLARAPERRIFYIDVGNLPKGKAEEYMRNIMSKYRNKLVYDAQTGEMRDDRKNMCLAMDTKVPLLDGRTLTLSEISDEFDRGKTVWVYSCDPNNGKFEPGLVTFAGITRKNAEVMKLTLDNGKSITCTPDHKFPVWNKGFVRADELVEGESMIPHYTRKEKLGTKTARYEQIFENASKEWVFTHRAVSQWKDFHSMNNEYYFNESYRSAEKRTVHHVNINPLDNTPENLVRMNSHDHFKMHGVIGTGGGKIGGRKVKELGLGYFNKEHPDFYEWKKAGGRIGGKVSSERGHCLKHYELERERLAELIIDPEWNDWFRSQQIKGWTEEKRAVASDHAKRLNLSARGNDAIKQAFADKNSEANKKRAKFYRTSYSKPILDAVTKCAQDQLSVEKTLAYLNSEKYLVESFAAVNVNKVMGKQKAYDRFNRNDVQRISREIGSNSYSDLKTTMQFRNHKIVKIEKLNDRMDTGCLTIDGNEIFHNHHTFALDAGIYTKNSMLEDFWLPRREGGRGTEIDTLSGGENLGQIDDILYFQKKVYGALNVPLNRLEEDTPFSMGRATEITRDELQFQRFVDRLRRRFNGLFFDLLKTQLILKGIINDAEWEDISQKLIIDYRRDNHFAELKDAEVLQDRLRLLSDLRDHIGTYYSHEWIRKNILKQTDEDIKEIDKEIEQEKKDPKFKEEDESTGRRW